MGVEWGGAGGAFVGLGIRISVCVCVCAGVCAGWRCASPGTPHSYPKPSLVYFGLACVCYEILGLAYLGFGHVLRKYAAGK